ncbi:hypothetical protein [Stenotrophomonas sp. GD03997]|uniref:hypothetical protein n=4 Tax=unclassified Stenotrophomonas TaxID=196198 RepID=UPI0013109A94|nr:hypothetical protein [Stenotrophomonas sp. GD03997]MDH0576082.1 hypothetical protein [Stenotrophomonas sp. GD03997]
MHGPATFRSTSICLVLAALALSSLTATAAPVASKRVAPPPSLVQAYLAAEANLRLIPGDDIESDFRPVWTAVADLDGDGRAEVVYFYTSTYTGGSFAQRNVVAVMTALTAIDPRGQENPNSLSPVEAEDYAAIRQYGYGDDAVEQIPGAIRAIRIQGDRIIVDFTVSAGATVCEWKSPNRHVCPPDGNYTWTLRWTPGKLTRIKK